MMIVMMIGYVFLLSGSHLVMVTGSSGGDGAENC